MINVFGLAVGLAACMLILLYVNFELSYDRWIPDESRVMRVETRFYDKAGQPVNTAETIPPVTSPLFAEQIGDIEQFSRFMNYDVAVAVDGKAYEQNLTMCDPGVFDLMGIRLIEGDAKTALSDPGSIVLSVTSAKRIFGDQDALGKVVKLDGEYLARVTGIMPDWPKASDLEMHAIVPMTTPLLKHMAWLQTNWGSFWGPTYIRLRAGADPKHVADDINKLALRVGPADDFKDRVAEGIHPSYSYYLTLAADAHLKSTHHDSGGRSSVAVLWSAGVTAFLILAIAIINAANLGTMLAMKRVREVAIRKALGASPRNLMMQVLVETIALTFLSMVIGIALAELFLPTFCHLMDRSLSSELIYRPETLAILVGGTLVVGVICGLYPAMVAIRFRPVDYLAGVKPKLGVRFRNSLIVLQFAATIGLLTTCAVVFMQAQYARNADHGFDSSQLVDIGGVDRPVVHKREEALRQALARVKGVEAVGASHGMAGDSYNNNNGVWLPDGTMKQLRRFAMSEDLLPLMGVKPIAGRLFSKDHPSDSYTEPGKGASHGIIINDLAVKKLGFASAQDAVGKTVHTWDNFPSTIIGVIDNLRFRSAREKPDATYYWIGPEEYRHEIVKVSRQNLPETLAAIDKVWRDFFPDLPIRRQFVDEAFAKYYDTDRRQGWLLLFSAGVMVVIAVMGLYGLAALATERRAKEIGIRKVLGARTRNIVRLLLWQFSLPILVANLIAWPLSWWGLGHWLEGFIDRVGLSPLPFLGAGVLVLLIAWGTIIGHTLRVARQNPIKALRYE
nr:ABC transporter permease [Kordiimonas marina]